MVNGEAGWQHVTAPDNGAPTSLEVGDFGYRDPKPVDVPSGLERMWVAGDTLVTGGHGFHIPSGRFDYRYRSWFQDRNYELFTLLAGVRGFMEDAIVEPRGWPDSTDYDLRTCFPLTEYHHHTYYKLGYLKACLMQQPADMQDNVARFLLCLDEILGVTGAEAKDINVLICFDS